MTAVQFFFSRNYPSTAKSQVAEEQRKFKEDRKRKYIERLQEKRQEIELKRKKQAEELRAKREDRKRTRGKRSRGPSSLEPEVTFDPEESLPVWFGNISKFKGTGSINETQTSCGDDDATEPSFHISDDEWQTKDDNVTRISTESDLTDDPKSVTDDEIHTSFEVMQPSDDPSEENASVNMGRPQRNNDELEIHANKAHPEESPVANKKVMKSRTEHDILQDDDDAPPEECSSKTVVPDKVESLQFPTKRKAEEATRNVERRLLKRNRRQPTLLERLLKNEISKERDELLQCLRYVCAKNFFDSK